MEFMDHHHHDSDLMSDRPLETKADFPPRPAEQHASELVGVVDRFDLSLSGRCEVTQRLAAMSEARETKIRELQDAIKHETYHVTAEQIADKMLRRTLRDDLT